jgi:putative ABC transport system permease protein
MLRLSLPLFTGLTNVPVQHAMWSQGWFWFVIPAMFVVGCLTAGLYPVLVLSAFRPMAVLRGKFGASGRRFGIRKALVVFQFVMSIGLIIATLTVYDQISYMQNQDLRVDIDQVLVIKAPRVRGDAFASHLQAFRQELLQQSGIHNFCVATEVPGRQILWDAGGIHRAGSDISESKNYQIVGIDYDFVDTFGLTMVSGRNFSRRFPADKSALLLNETAVKWMGFESADAAVGQKVDYWGNIYTIAGVLQDYHQQYLRQAFEPHIFRLMPTGRDVRGHFAVKLSGQNIPGIIGVVEERFDSFFPGNPFEHFFLDTFYNQQYQSDQLFGRVFALFAILALFVTCLGIFGLSSFISVQRTKEIGIRKVLGASVPGIVQLLSKEFLLSVWWAVLVAWPVSAYIMFQWLQNYAYRTSLDAFSFFLAAMLVLTIAFFTMSSQVIKAASANPVQSLRYE